MMQCQGDELVIHGDYAKNSTASMHAVNKLKKKDELAAFLEVSAQCGMTPIAESEAGDQTGYHRLPDQTKYCGGATNSPVQRICKYPLLFNALCKHFPHLPIVQEIVVLKI